MGSFSGILAPIVASELTSGRTMTEWRTCFFVFSVVLGLGGLIFIFFSKGDLEEWAKEDTCKKQSDFEIKKIDFMVESGMKRNQKQFSRQSSMHSRDNVIHPTTTKEENNDELNKSTNVQNF